MSLARSECEVAVPRQYVTVQVRRGDQKCSGKFLKKRNLAASPALLASSRGLFSLSKLFQSVLFFFSLQKSGTDPTRPASGVPSRYSTLGNGGCGGLVAWTLRFSPASPPRGEYGFSPRFLFVNISQSLTGGMLLITAYFFLPV